MYIHIGAGENVRERDIIGVFDIDGKNYSDINRDFLREAEKKGRVDSAGDDLPRAFVLTSEGGGDGGRVILTHISSAGIFGRIRKRRAPRER